MDNTVNLNYPQQQNNVAYQDQNSNAQAGLSNTMTGAADPSGPLFFGNYEAVKAIGKGKFAVVYRAHKIGDDEVVALKRISVDMMNDKAREKCLKEVRLLQSLDHPNIIRYMDSFITDNDLIIIYEWAAAGDLKRQIRKAQEKGVGFEERVVWKYFSQIANAIQHMHDRRIMHRDLKPANIFLTLDGTIKVGDLGLSREFSEHTHQAHSKVGTPLYMSPEVINGVDGYDFKSDIWSLGCLLYELAVLKSPFKSEGINIYTLLTKISNGEYTPIPDHYSEELRNLAHAMISTKPEDRPDIHYICDVAQKMRALTASDRSNRMKRSFSRSEDLGGDATSEIKGETNRGRAPSDFTTTATDRERESKDNDDYQNNNNNKNNNNNMNTNNNSNNNSNNNRSIESREKERDSARQGINHSSNSSGRGREVSSARDSKESERDWKDRREERGMWEDERKEREVEVVTPQTYRLPPRSNSSNPFQTNYNNNNNNNNNNRNNTTNTSPPPSNSTSNTPSLSKKQLQYEDVVIPSDSSPVTSQKTSSSTTAVYRRSKPPRPDSASKNNNTNNNNGNNNSSNSSGSQRSRPVSGNVVDVDDVTSEPRSTSRPTSHYDNNHSNPSLADMGRQPSTSNLALMEGLENASAAFALMDAIYGKLTLLGYHMYEAGIDVTRLPSNQRGRGRLLPMHFAVNLRIFEKVAAHETSFQFQQFPRLVEVVTWLCCEKMAGSKAADVMRKVDLHNSNAVTVAKQMLLAAQAVGTLNDELSNVTPSSLLPGFGVTVCFLLSHFTDAALRATAFSPKPMVYATSSEDPTFDTGEAGEAEDESEAVEESSEGEGEGEGETVDVNSLENQHYLDGKEEDDESDLAFSLSTIDRVAAIENGGRVSARRRHGGIIESRGIDPLTWRQETERVTPSLKAAEKAWMTSGQTSWQSHVSLVQKYCQEISYSRNGRRADVTVPPPSSSAAASIVVESLTSVQGSLSSELAGIKKAERLLNARHDVLDHLSTYATLKTNLDNFLARSQSTQHVIDQLSSSLADKEELLQELQLSLQDRRGGNESDLNPVVRYKEAILRLQSEIREMFLSTNLISVQLMQCRQRQHNSRLEKMAKHRKRRARLRGKKLGKDDVISSEEEA